jgi:hypothetical protein
VLTVSGIVLVSWFLIALAHIDDTYRVDHVSGAVDSTRQVRERRALYPPLFNGHVFGGTRSCLLNSSCTPLVHVTGEYLVSGKPLAYASAVGMYVLRHRRAREGAVVG